MACFGVGPSKLANECVRNIPQNLRDDAEENFEDDFHCHEAASTAASGGAITNGGGFSTSPSRAFSKHRTGEPPKPYTPDFAVPGRCVRRPPRVHRGPRLSGNPGCEGDCSSLKKPRGQACDLPSKVVRL